MTEHPEFPKTMGFLEASLSLAKDSTVGNQEQQTG